MNERSEAHWRMRHEARVAQRLCERTARLYRRLHTVSTFLSVIGGSGAMVALVPSFPAWVSVLGACTLAIAIGISLALVLVEGLAS